MAKSNNKNEWRQTTSNEVFVPASNGRIVNNNLERTAWENTDNSKDVPLELQGKGIVVIICEDAKGIDR